MSTFQPGQSVKCTVIKAPRTEDAEQTVLRLMRNDPQIRKALRRSQDKRANTTETHGRGGRTWYVRQKVSTIAKAQPGESWQMLYSPLMEGDLRAIGEFIKVEPA